MAAAPPPLTVVLATTHPWPAVQACLEILCGQCRPLGAEIVVGDSTGCGLPEPRPEWLRDVRWVVVPGASVFDLRAAATEAAAGSIVAWTEDHCRPAADWCQQILQAHAEFPESSAIGGAVLNGSTQRAMDWANFLCTFGPFLPPLGQRRIGRVPAAANVSFKKSAIPPGRLSAGFMELLVEPRLWADRKVHFDDRIVVTHIQSWGFWGTPVAHFHNGRSTTGLVAAQMSWFRRIGRMFICLVLPAEILRTAVGRLVGRPGIPILRSLPLMTILAVAHSAGEFTGLLLRGAGMSPVHLE